MVDETLLYDTRVSFFREDGRILMEFAMHAPPVPEWFKKHSRKKPAVTERGVPGSGEMVLTEETEYESDIAHLCRWRWHYAQHMWESASKPQTNIDFDEQTAN